MATVPITLDAGYVLVYGPGSTTGGSGVQYYPVEKFRYGTVSQVYDGSPTLVGTQVAFNTDEIQAKLFYLDWPYLMIPEVKLATEVIPP